MRFRRLFFSICSFSAFCLPFSASQAGAAGVIVRSGDTIQLGTTTYRLDGIDAPEVDQLCIDDHADPWSCGTDVRDQLTRLIGGREVHCEDLGPDPVFKKWHVGICTVEGDTASLNQSLVRLGFAIPFEPAVKMHLKDDASAAKASTRGIWKGCFVAPQEFRAGKKDGALLGASCRSDRDPEIRAVLFPDDPAMPPACSIKGKFAVRARVTGHVGIYHLQGCIGYPPLTRPDRWFCSEDDAQAAGFRRAFNCRPDTAAK
ncbi:thermonuclease family protein [Bradyrhizobium sp.]|uniref:thermonuclease family protein n=1 Tax=Bradyrhizobium sp. TaxID=376 RepID=UPI003C4B394D